jgi:predicted patatin/cPLA2 family phospholipase
MTQTLSIIPSGGGMRCSYGAGVMVGLAEELKVTKPSSIISASGSAGTASYYLAKQYESIRRIWTELLTSSEFLNSRRILKMIDIDYLIDEVFKKQELLDINAVLSSQTRLYIPAICKSNGKVEYFENDDTNDLFEVLRAAKAIPIAFCLNPEITISGLKYCDTELTSKFSTHLQKASIHCDKILVVNHNPNERGFNRDKLLFNLWIYSQKRNFRRGYSKSEIEVKQYEPDKRLKIFKLSTYGELEISLLENDKKSLEKAFEQGYYEARYNSQLREFVDE